MCYIIYTGRYIIGLPLLSSSCPLSSLDCFSGNEPQSGGDLSCELPTMTHVQQHAAAHLRVARTADDKTT